MVAIAREDSFLDFPSVPVILNRLRAVGSSWSSATSAVMVPYWFISAVAMVELTNGSCCSMMIHAFSLHTFAFFSGLSSAAYSVDVFGMFESLSQ